MGVTSPRNRAFTIVVSVLVALAAIPVLILVAASGAPAQVVLAVILASVPVVPLVMFYLWLDRYEPEPRVLLSLALAWGAFVACFAALVLEGVGGVVTGLRDNGSIAVVAPVAEEACKGFFLVMLLWWRRDELDGVLDGIVYAGMVGIGFAFIENILYLGAAYNGTSGVGPGGARSLAGTFVIRCLLSPFAHPMFTAFTGIGVGIAVGSRARAVRFVAPLGGYVVAVLAHGTWNAATIFGLGSVALVYVVLMLPAVFGLTAVAVWARRSERRMLALALGDAARRGLLPATDIGWVVDLGARRSARAYARRWGGPAGEHAMREYQQAAIELGFLHSRFLRGTPPPNFAARGQEYVARIGAVRPRIAFPGQVVPTT